MSGKSGSVVLFLRRLPLGINRRDLKRFVQREMRAAGIVGMPLMNICANCNIVRITDLTLGTEEYHGLIEVQPARVAMLAMEALNGKPFAGAIIEIRRYRQRSPWGEHLARREDDPANLSLGQPPLRERRRPNLRIDLVDATPGHGAKAPSPVLA